MNLSGQLYRLQQIDAGILRNQQELGDVEHQLSDNKVLMVAESKLSLQEQQLAEAKKQQKSLEWELEDIQQKLMGFNNKLYSGTTKNPKELVNIESEVKSLKGNISKREDELLGLMSQVEDMEVGVKVVSEEFTRLTKEWQEKREVLERRKTEIGSEIANFSEDREGLVQLITPEALRLYAQVKLAKGQAVVKVERGKCQGCYINLPTSQWQRARAGDLLRCNSCGRILYLE